MEGQGRGSTSGCPKELRAVRCWRTKFRKRSEAKVGAFARSGANPEVLEQTINFVQAN